MRRLTLIPVAALACTLALAGCGHVDLTPESDPNRTVSGTVNVRMDLMPPADAQLVVRVVRPPDVTAAPASASSDLVIGQRGTREQPERVVAEQVIRAPGALPVPFRLEFRADDAQLRHGLNIEARLSWGGQLRFRTVESQVVTPANLGQPVQLWVDPVR